MNMLRWFQTKGGTEESTTKMETLEDLLRDYQRSSTPEHMSKMLERIQSQYTVQHKLVQKLLYERNHVIRINKEIATKNSELEKLVEKQRIEINHLKQETNCYGQASGYVSGYMDMERNMYNGDGSPQCVPGMHVNWQVCEGSRIASLRMQESLKRKKLRQVYVYLYSPQRDQIPPVSDITSRIGEVLVSRDIELIPEVIEETPVPEQARPAILLCVNVSRLGTDVSNALKDVRAGEDVAVVVLHHKDVHVLPKLSSEKSLTGAEFQELGAIVDMAFWKEKGLHQCDINQTAIMKLADFLTDYAIP